MDTKTKIDLMYMLYNGNEALTKTRKFANELAELVPEAMYIASICTLLEFGVEKYGYDIIKTANIIADNVKIINKESGDM